MKKISKGMLMTALICGAVYLGGSPVYASELQEFSLDEYVVTAARTETKLVDTPANISVVDAQTIEERHYQDVSEVLKDVPGANVLDTGVGAFEKTISLNGDSRVLILVDGRRVDFASGTSYGRGCVDMGLLPNVNLIERIEILKGAGGALYGSDAVGGVVNIITKKADSNYGRVNLGFGSNGTKDYNAMYSLKTGKTGMTLSASKYEQDYYKYKDAATGDTKRWPDGSEMDSEKVSIKIDQELDQNTDLEIGYDYSKYQGLSMGSLTNTYGVSNVEKESNNVYAKLNWLLNEKDHGYVQIYNNEYKYHTVRKSTNILDGDVDDKTIGVDLQQAISVSDNNKIVAGFSWRKSDVLNVSDAEDWSTGIVTKRGSIYDETIENTAIFLNDTWEFVPTWTLNAGVRYDDHSKSGDETTLSVGLNKKFDDNSHAYINWGEVFKTPTTGDLFAAMGGNPNLKAETGDSWTVGYSTKLNEKTNIGISYFESDLENAIVWGGYQMENVSKQKKQGVELTATHELNDNVDLEASYSYIKVKENTGTGFNKDEAYIPNTYRLGVRYHEGKWNANVWMRYGSGADDTMTLIDASSWGGTNYLDGEYADSNYLTIDVAITYKANKDLSFYAKGFNIFNESYADFHGTTNGSYDYPAQSRRFIVGAEYKF